ncbi:MAG: reverse transcriptase family protein, partial [Candidatus Thiodiazotropha sp.]
MNNLEALCVEIKTDKKEVYMLVVVYVPPNKLEQMSLLGNLVKQVSAIYKNVIVTGDMNAKSAAWGNLEVNGAGNILEGILDEHDLVCLNDFQPTYRSSHSVIDLFLVRAHLNRKTKFCQTLTHENVRTDHISVLLELDDGIEKDEEVSSEKYCLRKIDWQVWVESSEESFKEWNSVSHDSESIDQSVDSFMEVFHGCMDKAIPRILVKEGSRRKKAPWINEDVKEIKHQLNVAKKKFRRRQTPNNLNSLRETEIKYDAVCEKAKHEWTEQICCKINECKNPKEMWQNFRALTSYQDEDTGGVLPLIGLDQNPIFDPKEKCKILEDVFFGGKHLEEEKFDDNLKTEVEETVAEIVRQQCLDSSDMLQFLNRDITEEETEAALQGLLKGKAPGSDLIYTDLLLSAGDELRKAIHYLFFKSWKAGICPKEWKVAAVKFLKKNGKSDYHQPSAYRPISLTSCLGKCMEKIITTRLYGYSEHHNLLDKEQEGFRRFRSTTQALLRITQDIMNGFNEKETTVAVMVDLEKAYDSVWRDGLLFKLHKKGIQGRIWFWLRSFLQDRTASCRLGNQEGEKFVSKVGLPQGSVLSPLLFNLYIEDIYQAVSSEKVKFADDGTLWRKGRDIQKMTEVIATDLEEIKLWVKRWRMKLNISKTEYCIFSRDQTILDQQTEIRMANTILKRTRNPKLLGVILDERLTFQDHVKMVEHKAQKVISSLNILGRTEHIDPVNMVRLYKSIVVPQLEYASPVWQSGHCEALDKVQRRGLAICLGVPATASLEALEVEAGVLPLDLRREELAIREFGKIYAKQDTQPVKQALQHWEEIFEESHERYISPFGKMKVQMADMCSNTDLIINSIEPEANFQDTLQPAIKRPEYWNILGSSKNRTKLQEGESRKLIER